MVLSKYRNKVTAVALAGVMGLSMCSPVLAMAAEGDTASSNITIEAEATSINMTVPTNAAFVFKGDGTNVYPSNYEITNNNGLTAVTLNSIDFEGVNGWKLTTEDDTFQADQKKFALWMGARGNDLSVVDVNDGVVFAGDTEIKIAPNSSKILDFEAKRGVFSEAVTTENAMQMTMHFDWEHAKAPQLVEKTNMAYTATENNRSEIVQCLGGVSDGFGIKNDTYDTLFTIDNPNINVSYNYSGTPLFLRSSDAPYLADELKSLYSLFSKVGATSLDFRVYATTGNKLTVDFPDDSKLVIDGNSTLIPGDATIYIVDAEDNSYVMYSYVYNEDTWEIEEFIANSDAAFKTLQYE